MDNVLYFVAAPVVKALGTVAAGSVKVISALVPGMGGRILENLAAWALDAINGASRKYLEAAAKGREDGEWTDEEKAFAREIAIDALLDAIEKDKIVGIFTGSLFGFKLRRGDPELRSFLGAHVDAAVAAQKRTDRIIAEAMEESYR
jgi:hypothetical protein